MKLNAFWLFITQLIKLKEPVHLTKQEHLFDLPVTLFRDIILFSCCIENIFAYITGVPERMVLIQILGRLLRSKGTFKNGRK